MWAPVIAAICDQANNCGDGGNWNGNADIWAWIVFGLIIGLLVLWVLHDNKKEGQ